MRLAFITQDFPPEIGGIQTYSIEIAQRIYNKFEDFIVIAPYHAGADKIDNSLPFDIYRINCRNTLLGISAIPSILPIFRKRSIDTTFHVQWQTVVLSYMAKKYNLINKVTCAANIREYYHKPFHKLPVIARFYEKYKHLLLEQVDHFFPVSQFTGKILQENGVKISEMDVVINGTNPEHFYPMKTEDLKPAMGLSGKKVILTISRLIELKGIDTVLKALSSHLDKIADVHYLIVGNGPYQKELQRLTSSLGLDKHVTFTGKVPYSDIQKYYNLCDIFVMPSKTRSYGVESFGIVFLEANACGKPVIGSKTGGIPDAVLDGETGLLVEEQNPKELAEAIDRLLINPDLANELGSRGRKWVENEANWDVSAQKIVNYLLNKI